MSAARLTSSARSSTCSSWHAGTRRPPPGSSTRHRHDRVAPVEVVTDHAPVFPAVLEELLPAAWHRTDRYVNNQIEADHGPPQGEAAADARAQAGPQRQDRDRRTRVHAERSTRAL